MYLFDTDHLVILQRASDPQYARLTSRMAPHHPDDFFLSIVSFHEQMLGWNAYIGRARDRSGVIRGYGKLYDLLQDFSGWQVLRFDDAAGAQFDALRQQRIRIATMDLRIAASAIANQLTVLSRNVVDFAVVPGLMVEDWTQ